MNSKALSQVLAHQEIKDFLSFYQSNERSEVLKLSILHTIYSLRSNYSNFPALPDFREIMSNAGKLKSLESTVAMMKQKLEMIKQEILHLENSLSKPAEMKTKESASPKEVISVLKPTSFQGKRSLSAPHISKAPSQWRQGDPSVFRNFHAENKPNSRNFLFRDSSPPCLRGHHYKEYLTTCQGPASDSTNTIYPDWWLALTELDVKPQKISQKITQSKIKIPSKTERKVWLDAPACPEEEEVEEPRMIIPRQRPQPVLKGNTKTCEKSAGADLPSVESSGNEARVHFNDKKYANWVGDFSKVVKGSTGKISNPGSKEISYTESSRKDHSSGYTSSSMTNYVPSNEMRQFYQGEFNRFLESKNGESLASGKGRSYNQYSHSSEDQKSSCY
jgi:hypothetical protein